MAATLSKPQLSLDLPNTRMSVDFSTFVGTQSTPASHHITSRAKIMRRPLPSTSQLSTVAGIPLPEIQEEPSENLNTSTAPSRQNSVKWPWRRLNDHQGQSNVPVVALVRTDSNASTASTASTAASSVFSHAQSTSTRSTSSHTLYSTPSITSKDATGLSNLPLSLLEHILSFALSSPLQVSIGPDASDTHHLSHRYHPAGLDYVDLRRILKHPLFFVSRHIREVSLDVLYRKSEFVIDLHKIYHSKVSSTINENLKKHQKFWMSGTPQVVIDALPNIYRLHLRLPVPSTEAASYRGRDEDDWMTGSDGKGGGNWKAKSMKREHDDALQIQKCINAIKELLMADKRNPSELQRLSRSRSAVSLRRTKSSKGTRSRSADNVEPRSESPANNGGNREPMKRLEITLIKRSPWALVLPESLELVRAFRSVPVSGFTRYHFELNGQRFLWAAKLRKKWQGIEPDGSKLLQGLLRSFSSSHEQKL